MADSQPILVGVDETGYGAIAGPVTVCAAAIRPEWRSELEAMKLRDSKALKPERRREIADWIVERKAAVWAIVNEPPHVIDQVGPFGSVCKGARTALIVVSNQLGHEGDLSRMDVLMDGKDRLKGLPKGVKHRCLVGADDKVLEVMVASILAKVHRDWLMEHLSKQYPIYEWEYNKGYSSDQHLEALYQYGYAPEHRVYSGVWKATKNYWEKTYKTKNQPMPKWLVDLNPRYALQMQPREDSPRAQTQRPGGAQPTAARSS